MASGKPDCPSATHEMSSVDWLVRRDGCIQSVQNMDKIERAKWVPYCTPNSDVKVPME